MYFVLAGMCGELALMLRVSNFHVLVDPFVRVLCVCRVVLFAFSCFCLIDFLGFSFFGVRRPRGGTP